MFFISTCSLNTRFSELICDFKASMTPSSIKYLIINESPDKPFKMIQVHSKIKSSKSLNSFNVQIFIIMGRSFDCIKNSKSIGSFEKFILKILSFCKRTFLSFI